MIDLVQRLRDEALLLERQPNRVKPEQIVESLREAADVLEQSLKGDSDERSRR